MSRQCQLTGKTAMVGNHVSHANNKNKRRFLLNLCNVTLTSNILERSFPVSISAHTLRSVDHCGGLDAFLLKTPRAKLTKKAAKWRKTIEKTIEEKENSPQQDAQKAGEAD